jgi:hypothetical protein
MTLRSVMLQLREDQIAQLDADASRAGVSRSQLVPDAVDALISRPIDHDVAAMYRAAYPDERFGTDEWGDLDAWHEAAANGRSAYERESW